MNVSRFEAVMVEALLADLAAKTRASEIEVSHHPKATMASARWHVRAVRWPEGASVGETRSSFGSSIYEAIQALREEEGWG